MDTFLRFSYEIQATLGKAVILGTARLLFLKATNVFEAILQYSSLSYPALAYLTLSFFLIRLGKVTLE
jgi:hypothetical protein